MPFPDSQTLAAVTGVIGAATLLLAELRKWRRNKGDRQGG
jgi:hypothetical protein